LVASKIIQSSGRMTAFMLPSLVARHYRFRTEQVYRRAVRARPENPHRANRSTRGLTAAYSHSLPSMPLNQPVQRNIVLRRAW
jgi:hypothetical protein